jgi:prepilin-type N-terminal cleavage/methylation domain-containing protein
MKRNRNQSGFTLMEAMMAVVILAVAASGISMAFAAAAATQTEANRQVLASRLAADLIEKIVATGYGDINQTKYLAGIYSAEGIGCTGAIYEKFSCTLAYGNVSIAGSPPVNLIQVTVVAKYNDQEITRMTTLIGDKNRH